MQRPPISTLFPYTTLFRSSRGQERWTFTRICTLDGRVFGPPRLASIGSNAKPHERSEEHTSELQSHSDLVCRLLLEKKKNTGDKTDLRRSRNEVGILNSNC